jgi:phosphate-selective porin OprO/OprP
MSGKRLWLSVLMILSTVAGQACGQAPDLRMPVQVAPDAPQPTDAVGPINSREPSAPRVNLEYIAAPRFPVQAGFVNSGDARLLPVQQVEPKKVDTMPPPGYTSPYPLYDILGDRKRSTDILNPADAAKTPGYPTVKLTGFFQADFAWFAQDANSVKSLGNIQDDRGFRRARLAAVGDVMDNVSYMLEMDFAFPGRPSFMDVWLDVHKLPVLGNVRVGQYRVNFGMDELTSVRELQSIERGITFGLAPFRQMAVGFHNANEEKTVTWAVDGFGYPSDFFGNSTGDRGYGMAGRITALPYFDEEDHRLVHVGLDYTYLDTSTGNFRFRNQAEYGGQFGPLGLGNTVITNVPFFVDTGVLPASITQMVNGEVAFAAGSLYAQSEVRYAFVRLQNGNYTTLPTMYAQVGYFLTGEQRPYNKNNAVFGRVKPLHNFSSAGGIGAWELAFRYSYANFHNNVNPGFANELTDTTLGLNWYLNQYTKFQANWIHTFLSPGSGLPSGTDTLAIRAQLDF